MFRSQVLLVLCYASIVNGKIIDMTYVFGVNATSFPGNPPVNISNLVRGQQEQGFWLEYNWFSTNEHRGTHMDSPIHFFATGMTMDQVPIEKLIGPGIVLRAIEEAKTNPVFLVTKQFIQNWESKNGEIPEKAIVMLDFGWEDRYKDFDNNLIFNTETYENVSSFRFPGIAADGMEYLAIDKRINVVGTDTPSIDYGQSQIYESHVICAKNGVPIIENIANLHLLPLKGSRVFASPLKLEGGSGSPARVFAIINEDEPVYDSATVVHGQVFTIGVIIILFYLAL